MTTLRIPVRPPRKHGHAKRTLLASLVLGLGLLWAPAGWAAMSCPSGWSWLGGFGAGSGNGEFIRPSAVALSAGGATFVADDFNARVQKFNTNGTFALAWGEPGANPGQLSAPSGMAVDNSGVVYVVDAGNDRIQKFDSNGAFQGQFGTRGSGDGQFDWPYGVAVDVSGNIYVTDAGNNRVQKFNSAGEFERQWGGRGKANGQFDAPAGIAVDLFGNVYVADKNNHRIQKFTANGAFVDAWGGFGTGDKQFVEPFGVAVDAVGHVVVADTGNNVLKRYTAAGDFLDLRTGFIRPRGVVTRLGDVGMVADTGGHRVGHCSYFNSPPTIANVTASGLEDQDLVFTAAVFDGGFTDVDTDILARLRITSLPGAGQLLLDGAPVSANQEIVGADLDKLRYKPVPNYFGSGVTLGWQASDGAAWSGTAIATLNIQPVNDAPSFTAANPPDVDEDAGAQTIEDWASFNPGPGEAQTATYVATVTENPGLFADAPTVDPSGTLRYTTAPDAYGSSKFTVYVRDDGGTANGGVDTSAAKEFEITVNPVNDAPVIAQGASSLVVMDEDGSPIPFVLTLSASDVEGDPITWGIGAPPSRGVAGVVNGVVSYAPQADYAGSDSFSVVVSDNHGAMTSHTVNVTIRPQNDPPTAASQLFTIAEDTSFTFGTGSFGFADIDGHGLAAVEIVNPPTAGNLQRDGIPVLPGERITAADLAMGKLIYTPAANAFGNGYASLVFRVEDSSGDSSVASYTATFNVTPVNDAPTIAGTPPATVFEGAAYTFTPVASDVDTGDSLSFSITNQPAWASFDNTDGTLTGTPGNEHVGTTAGIVITVSDGTESTSLPPFSITVINVNDPPTISGTPPTTVAEGSLYSFTPSASDVDVGDTLTFSIVNQPAWANFDTATGTLSGTPGNDHVGTTAAIVITVSDGTVSVALPAFSITVTNVNDPPVISGTPATSVAEGSPYSFIPSASDVDVGDTLTFSIANPPAWSSFDTATGALTGTPGFTDAGSYPGIVIGVSDGTVTVNLPAFTIEVTNVNRSPVISGSPATTVAEDSAYSFTPTVVDPDSDDTLVFSIVNPPAWASFDTTTGALTGTPDNDHVGTSAGIVISVSDGYETAALPPFSITVTNTNDAPTITGTPALTVAEGQPYTFTPSASDVDVGDTLTFSIDNPPAWASFDANTGTLSGTPGFTDAGSYPDIVITVSDGTATASLPAFTIQVTNTNRPPVISGSPATSVDQDSAYEFTPTASDPDADDSLSFTIANQPAWAVFDPTSGRLSGTPGNADVGSYPDIVISVDDGTETVHLQAFTLTVVNVNDPPVISGTPPTTVAQGKPYGFTPSAEDVDVGDTLTFSVDNKPAWLKFNTATGTLAGTPGKADVGVYPDIIISVSDGQATASLPAFTLTVTDTNDPPTINGVPPDSVLQDQPYSFIPQAWDPEGDTLVFAIGNKPVWASFDAASGALTGTPSRAHAGRTSNIVISVSDGEHTVSLPPFAITVFGDLDGDGIADEFDDDIDGDGIPNDVELAYGLDPYDPTDALGDLDGDGVSNLDEYLNGTDLSVDDYPPLVTPPADITVGATGLLTRVSLGEASAHDHLDGDLPASTDHAGVFSPGRHRVTWSATDAAGNTGTAEQIVRVLPQVALPVSMTGAEGSRVRIRVQLNGEAPDYPVLVPYTVSGSAVFGEDHSLANGTVSIHAGTEAVLEVDVYDDGLAEGEETLLVTLGEPVGAVRAPLSVLTLRIVEQNVAPEITLVAEQALTPTMLVAQDGGPLVVRATVVDPNPGDSHVFDWELSDAGAVDLDSDPRTLTLDAALLPTGPLNVRLRVTDAGGLSGERTLRLRVVAAAPPLGTGDSDGDGIPDLDEGTADSDGDGIPDYLDPFDGGGILASRQGENGGYLLEAEPGIGLRLGEAAFILGLHDAELSAAALLAYYDVAADDQVNVGGYFDFELTGLAAGESARLVLPQRAAIPADPVYRKLIAGQWRNFVEDGANALASAPGEAGICPPPGDSAYQLGLGEGHWCVQLLIQDGGPNDADGVANGVVLDPGGVAMYVAPEPEPEPEPAPQRRGGGGGLGVYGLVMLLWMAALGRRTRSPEPRV